MLSDLILRIGESDSDTLRRIYRTEIVAKGWTEEERRILTNAFDNRATALNAEAIGMNLQRWKGMGAA